MPNGAPTGSLPYWSQIRSPDTLMKQLLPLAVFLLSLIPVTLGAQSPDRPERRVAFGLLLGLERVSYRTDIRPQPSLSELVTSTTLMPTAGVSILAPIAGRIYFAADLTYQQFAFATERPVFEVGSSTAVLRADYEQQSLGLSPGARYLLRRGRTAVFADAGLLINLPLSSRIYRRTLIDGRPNGGIDRPIEGADYGLHLGGGLRVGGLELRGRFTLTDRSSYRETFTSRRLGAQVVYWL